MSFGTIPGEFRNASKGRGRESKNVNKTVYIKSLIEWYLRTGKMSRECHTNT